MPFSFLLAYCLTVSMAATLVWPAAAHAQHVVSGVVRWAPTSSSLLPVRFASVHVIDAEHEIVLDTTHTDATGAYRVTLTWPGVKTVLVSVRTESPYAYVVAPGSGRTYEARSTPEAIPPGGEPLEVSLIVAWAQDTTSQAFSVMSAIEYGAAFRLRRAGAAPPPIPVVFPADRKASSFDGTRMFVRLVNARDWDVVLHEYGHYVAKLDSMTEAVGGDHNINEPIMTPKRHAVRLAWSEGWATWFSISAQREARLAKLGIPHVGDTQYTDTALPRMGSVDLATPNPPWAQGERSEVTVMRLLYNLENGGGPQLDDPVALGTDRLWSLLRAGRPNCLWDAWKLVAAGLAPGERDGAAAVLEASVAAPIPLRPVGGAVLGGDLPRFTWKARGTTVFALTVFGANGAVIDRWEEIKDGFLNPSRVRWARIRAAAGGGTVFWQVEGSDATPPATGPYLGTRRALTP